MHKYRLLAVLLIPSQLISLMAFQPAVKADSWKDVEDLIELVKSTGTKVQKTGECEGNTMGFYQPPLNDGRGDRLVFCTNNINMEDVSAVWEVLAHESAHVMQACNRGLIWKQEYHPRMLRNLISRAPHYAAILDQYRGRDKMIELEAFDMELKSPRQVIDIFISACSTDDTPPNNFGSDTSTTQPPENEESILSIVGGEDSFKVLIAWARDNLSQEELLELRDTLQSGDMPSIKKILTILLNRFNQSQTYENYRLF